MSVLKYKDPVTGEVKKVGSPQVDVYSKTEIDTKLFVHVANKNNPHGVTPSQIGAYSKAEVDTKLSSAAPAYTYGTADLTAGTSALETGKLYFVYE